MIILDTHVISEPMRPESDPRVDAWLDRQEPAKLYLTAVNLAELLFGIERIQEGRRKQGLIKSLAKIRGQIASELLAFDEAAAISYSELMTRTRAAEFQISEPDAQIAAIAAVHGFTVATRDVGPFRAAGVPVINPWEE